MTGLVAKPFAPRVPLVVLALAGALPDAVFFILQFLGIESFNLDQAIANRGGCFPYTNDYPLSHSLAGMVGVGANYLRAKSRNTAAHDKRCRCCPGRLIQGIRSRASDTEGYGSHNSGECQSFPP